MHGSLAQDTYYGSVVLEAVGDGDLVVFVREGQKTAEVTLSAEQVSALRIWLGTPPPAAPTASGPLVRTASGLDYVAWRNRIRRAARQHPEA